MHDHVEPVTAHSARVAKAVARLHREGRPLARDAVVKARAGCSAHLRADRPGRQLRPERGASHGDAVDRHVELLPPIDRFGHVRARVRAVRVVNPVSLHLNFIADH